MGERLKHTEILRLEDMPFESKVIMLFKMFPRNQSYAEQVQELLRYQKNRVEINCSYSEIYFIEIHVSKLGSFKKIWEEDPLTEEKIYRFSYSVGDEYIDKVVSKELNKAQSDLFCERALPFMLSHGYDRRKIPLLINDFPEFANFALEYSPCGR